MRRIAMLFALGALAASSLVPAPVAARAAVTAGAPTDYTRVSGLSKPTYKTMRESFQVEMKDGTLIYVEVERPKAPGRFATILELSPYHGTLADRMGTRILPGPVDKDGNHIGLAGYFAPRGYAVVFADLRGTGRSTGCLDHLGPNDATDSYEIVEWAAKQKWSNGRVGMTGHSYVGSTPQVAAAQNPPHLTTIVPSAGLAQMYDHKFQNGVPYNLQWAGPLFAYETLAMQRFLPDIGPVPVLGGGTGDNFGSGDVAGVACGWQNSTVVTGDAYMRGHETQWDKERDWSEGATKADIPVFIVHGVNDNAARIAAAAWYHDRKHPDDKAWIGQWDHGSGRFPNNRTCPQTGNAPCANDQWTEALHAWFDKWLQGRKVDTGPPVEIFLNTTDVFTAPDWPVPGTKKIRFYARSDNTLGASPGEDGSLNFVTAPQSGGNYSVEFESPEFKKDTLIVGMPKLKLFASQTTPLTHINATLYDVAGSTPAPIGQANWAIQPELRDGIDKPQPVIPTEHMTIDLTSMAQAHLLKAGHKLRLVISGYNQDKVPTMADGTVVTVYVGGDEPTHFEIPVIENPVLYTDPLKVAA